MTPCVGTVLNTAFYSLSGAKIGRRVLFALTEPIVEPGLLVINDGCFVGDFSHISSFSAIPSHNGGAHRASSIHLEEGSLVGMNAVIQDTTHTSDTSNQSVKGLRLPKKCIVGANSALDQNTALSMERSVKADGIGVSLFGQHTFKQEAGDSPALPAWSSWWTFFYNAVWPIVVMPALLSWFILSMLFSPLLVAYVHGKWGFRTAMALTGPLYCIYTVCVLSQLIIGKWILVSKFTKKSYKIDSAYFFRRLAYAHCLDFAALFCLEMLKGTPLLPMVYNLLGARIGSRVHLDTLAITEPDLCVIQDNCSINSSAVLFGHGLDRGQFSQAPLKVGAESTLDNHSLLLLGTTLGNFTHLKHSTATLPNSSIAGASEYKGVPPQVQQSFKSLSHEHRAWKARPVTATKDTVSVGEVTVQHAIQNIPPLSSHTTSSAESLSNTSSSIDSKTSSQTDLASNTVPCSDESENQDQDTRLYKPDMEKRPLFGSQYKGARPEYRDPETLDQPKTNTNLDSLITVFSTARDKAQTSLKAIDRAFEEEVKFWHEQFSTKLAESQAASPETKNTLLELGRLEASFDELNLLVNDVRNLPDSGETTISKAQDATLTDWAEHRQQLSKRVERMRNPKPYEDHSGYTNSIYQDYGLVALDLLCQGELDWMIWQSFAWTVCLGCCKTFMSR